MNSSAHTVDILMATYNGEKYIRQQIESLQAQTYSDWRLLASDDGSSDETLAIVHELASEDDRIMVVSPDQPFRSAYKNFLFLLSRSTAEYAMFCDQDDVWLPQKVELSLARAVACEAELGGATPAMVFSDSSLVDASLNEIAPSFVSSLAYPPAEMNVMKLLYDNIVQGSAMLMNRALIDLAQAHPMPEERWYHDYWITTLACATGRIEYIDQPLMLYRQHGGNALGAGDSASGKPVVVDAAYVLLCGDHDTYRSWAQLFSQRAQDLLQSGVPLSVDLRVALEQAADILSNPKAMRLKFAKENNLFRAPFVPALSQRIGLLSAKAVK